MNTYDYENIDKYDQYEALFDPLRANQRLGRQRRQQPHHTPKIQPSEIIEDLAEDPQGLEGGFNPTYQPSRYERGWLLDSLREFYTQSLISDVLAQVRGGKEANVYCCSAHPTTGKSLLAAKVYRPRQFRSLSNDAIYRQGRSVLIEEGGLVLADDHRATRAMEKKSAFGMRISHTSWLLHEYTTLQRLYTSGGAVPRPYAVSENAILMNYCGDRHLAAPALNEVKLDPTEVQTAWVEVMRNVELMLNLGMVHGDLSAYNILIWEGKITLIDFPQVVNIEHNVAAWTIFKRDILRTCDYFRRQGISCNGSSIAEVLWERYGVDPNPPLIALED